MSMITNGYSVTDFSSFLAAIVKIKKSRESHYSVVLHLTNLTTFPAEKSKYLCYTGWMDEACMQHSKALCLCSGMFRYVS